MTYERYALCVLLFLVVISGCTVQYPVVGYYHHYNEVVEGTITHNPWLGQGDIEVEALVSGIKGHGSSYITYIPPSGTAKGQRGGAVIVCDDGRIVQANWVAESLTTGYGWGEDQFGYSLVFRFGMSQEAAENFVKREMAKAALREPFPAYEPQKTRKKQGFSVGTGFFVSNDGYLITNYHVVEDSTDLVVELLDGERFSAEFVRGDRDNDLALLKIEAYTQALRLYTEEGAAKGQNVLVLGYPQIDLQGQEQKATFGRVNSLTGPKGDPRFYQIDVPIQPGNSGSPLIDTSCRVVGVITATLDAIIALRKSGHLPQNVNYAVKSEYVLEIMSDIDSSLVEDRLPEAPPEDMTELIEEVEKSVVLVIAK